jgi:hypothetical protein
MNSDFWIAAKIVAALVGACAGCFAGFGFAYYFGDQGDVGTAMMTLVTVPSGVILGALLGWLGLRRIERKLASTSD